VDRFREADLEFLGALTTLTGAALEGAERYRRAAAAEANASPDAGELVGASPAMQRLRAQIQKCASAARAHVFVRGESGSGKELVARTLHALSPRADQPFVTLNCAAMPESMVESELFGHEKGAFTGAARAKRGRFALAHRGTLFLDEIGDLSLAAQAKVLRAVQEGEVQPLGSEQTIHVDVRVLSATHKDLAAEAAAHRFREDLFYRLNVVELEVPPLRERGDDVVLLAHRFLGLAATRAGKRFDGFSDGALERLRAHPWPGNVRQLMNEIERAVILSDGPVVGVEDLSRRVAARPAGAVEAPRGAEPSLAERFAALETDERRYVAEALARARGNLAEGARILGITRIMMKRRVERFGLSADDDGG
jgi:Nif-specific regulatory protein